MIQKELFSLTLARTIIKLKFQIVVKGKETPSA